MTYSNDQTINSIKHSNSVLHMSNRHSPDNFVQHEPPVSATNSHDGEYHLKEILSKTHNANSMPNVRNESNDTSTIDHNHNPTLIQQESVMVEPIEQPNIMKSQIYEQQFEKRDADLESDTKQPFNFSSQFFDAELQNICDELEKARNENNERNRELRDSLFKFREEIENLKKQEMDTDHDREHAINQYYGFDKYSVLRRVSHF